MLTKEEKLKLKPITDKLKEEYIKLNPMSPIVDGNGKIEPDFMFWVVGGYEARNKKALELINEALKK